LREGKNLKQLKIVITDPYLVPPNFGTEGSAGLDLSSTRDTILDPGETILIDVGFRIWIEDKNTAGLVMARSGIASKKGLAPANKVGLIDSDYQGPLMVALHNHSNEVQEVRRGEKIAQLVLVPVIPFEIERVSEFTANTVRGSGGFGSTG
jgi:dUTP pyrophosphatase